jgi:hypothetical protein
MITELAKDISLIGTQLVRSDAPKDTLPRASYNATKLLAAIMTQRLEGHIYVFHESTVMNQTLTND